MDQSPPNSDVPPPSAQGQPAMSLAGRLLNVFADPGEVFEQVKTAKTSAGNWLVPGLILILVGWLGAWLIFSLPVINQQLSELAEKGVEKQIEKTHPPKEQADAMRQGAEKFGSLFGKIAAAAMPVIVAFISPFWWGLFLWLAGSKIMKGRFPFMKAVEVVGLANMIGVLSEVVRVLLVVGLGSMFASPSLAVILKNADPQSATFAILSLFNPLLWWELSVRSVGIARLSNVSFVKAAVWVFGIWLAFMGFMIGLGQLGRMAAGG